MQAGHHAARRIGGQAVIGLAALLAVAGPLRHPAGADAMPPIPTPSDEVLRTRQEIATVLQDVQRKYGRDAVLLEGHLLAHVIQGGSVLEAAVAVPGVEERAGKRFLTFKVDTGIIYNDRELSAAKRPARAWRDVVETTLRKFTGVNVDADGLALLLGYSHKAYIDEADLRTHLSEGSGDVEAVAFYLLLSDISNLLADRITGQQLADRSIILINGQPGAIVLDEPTPVGAAPTPQERP